MSPATAWKQSLERLRRLLQLSGAVGRGIMRYRRPSPCFSPKPSWLSSLRPRRTSWATVIPRERGEWRVILMTVRGLLEEFEALGYGVTAYADPGHFYVKGMRSHWRSLGLAEGKHVPASYLRSSSSQRLALVQGLIDSDGGIDNHGCYCFTNTSKRLIEDFAELVTSLGCVARVRRRAPRMRAGRPSRETWEVIVPASLPLSRLPRKALAARHDWGREQAGRYIVDVRPMPSVPVRCVQVNQP